MLSKCIIFSSLSSCRIHPSPTAGSVTAASSVSTVQGKPSLRRIKGRIHRSKSLDSIDLMDSNVSPPTAAATTRPNTDIIIFNARKGQPGNLVKQMKADTVRVSLELHFVDLVPVFLPQTDKLCKFQRRGNHFCDSSCARWDLLIRKSPNLVSQQVQIDEKLLFHTCWTEGLLAQRRRDELPL